MALVLHIREFVNNISMVIVVYRINGYISFIIVIISRMFIFIVFFSRGLTWRFHSMALIVRYNK
jgi:hypothetical protein